MLRNTLSRAQAQCGVGAVDLGPGRRPEQPRFTLQPIDRPGRLVPPQPGEACALCGHERRLVVELRGGLTVDLARQRCATARGPVPLTRTEFRILAALAETPGAVATCEALLVRVWGAEQLGITARNGDPFKVLRRHVCSLREKLAAHGAAEVVLTVQRSGYLVERAS